MSPELKIPLNVAFEVYRKMFTRGFAFYVDVSLAVCYILTDLNDKVRSHKVDWNVGVELCHKLPEVGRNEYVNISIHSMLFSI